ncbi:MAG: hypothetical protein NXH89_02140 [Cyclobacteriaceae bacterium]|nr:hypothetical protein [Cyclobacteriaceae bacterium]
MRTRKGAECRLEAGRWELEEGSRLWIDFRLGGSISLIDPWVRTGKGVEETVHTFLA